MGRAAAVHNSVLKKHHIIHHMNISCQSHNPLIRLSYKATVFGPQIKNEKQELSLTGGCAKRVWLHRCLADLIDYSLLTGDAEGGETVGRDQHPSGPPGRSIAQPSRKCVLRSLPDMLSSGIRPVCVCVYIGEERKHCLAEIHTDHP